MGSCLVLPVTHVSCVIRLGSQMCIFQQNASVYAIGDRPFLPRKPKQINVPSYWPIEGWKQIHIRDHEISATENGGFMNIITEEVCRYHISLDSRQLSSQTHQHYLGDFPQQGVFWGECGTARQQEQGNVVERNESLLG